MEYIDLLKFHQIIWGEVDNKSTAEYVPKYYNNVRDRKHRRWFHAHNWARRVENLVREITPGAKVLDSACGLGTEMFLAASLGAESVGVDIKDFFINGAKERKQHYEKKLGKSLDATFQHRSVTRMTEEDTFDVVWCMEAISHIYTTEAFLETSYKLLKKGGKLIISDPNAINPAIQLQYIKSSGFKRGTFNRVDPETGEILLEYDENILPPLRLAKMVRQAGFTVDVINYSVFQPPSLIYSEATAVKWRKFEQFCNRIPGFRHLGAVYTIVATK